MSGNFLKEPRNVNEVNPGGPAIRNDLALQIEKRGDSTRVPGSRANPYGHAPLIAVGLFAVDLSRPIGALSIILFLNGGMSNRSG